MRSNRSGYTATPAGSAKVLNQKAKPVRSKREMNQVMLVIFFLILPVLGLLSLFFVPIRWVLVLAIVLALAGMWIIQAFRFPGRMVLTGGYAVMLVIALVSVLDRSDARQVSRHDQFFPPMDVTAAPVTTPQFNYSTMGGDLYITSDTYDGQDDLYAVGHVGFGSGEVEGEEPVTGGEEESGEYVSGVKSEAEIALENFMNAWSKGIVEDMVTYTAASWQEAQTDVKQQLFWKFKQKPLQDWRQMDAPTGTDASGARTITIQADVNYGGLRTYEYSAIVLAEANGWAVDPDSLSTGLLVEQATPTPDPNATPTPTPEPTPTPTLSPKTKLYYNKKGGSYYHADKECYTVDKQYLPLSSFNYSDLSKKPYNQLKPCTKCNAPE